MRTKLAFPIILGLAFSVGLLAFARQTSHAETTTVRCVKPSGSDGCYSSIQAAINAANSGDIISVGVGTFYEHITVTKNLEIYGRGWTSSTIHGGYSQARATVYIPWTIDSSTIISGFQITGGGDGHPDNWDNDGGGISMWYASPRIINTWVYSCTARNGGGVFVRDGSPYFKNVPAWNNRAANRGGGFYIDSAQVEMVGELNFLSTNGTIFDNQAEMDGGGIMLGSDVTATIRFMQVISNSAIYGGGIAVENTSNPVRLEGNWIGAHPLFPGTGNYAKIGGDAGGGLYSLQAENLDLRNNWFYQNSTAGSGGGILINLSKGNVENNWVYGNTASYGHGGGIKVDNGSQDVRIYHNRIEANPGGGLAVEDRSSGVVDANVIVSNTTNIGTGTGIYIHSSTVTITNNIVAGNVNSYSSSTGNGISIFSSHARVINNTIANNNHGGVYLMDAEGAKVINNIIAFNVGNGLEAVATSGSFSYTADYNDVYNNDNNYYNFSAGTHDIFVNPLFVGSGDWNPYYHIQPSSPVSVSGSLAYAPPFDIDGQPRFLGGSVSMGADEIVPVQYDLFLPLVLKNYP